MKSTVEHKKWAVGGVWEGYGMVLGRTSEQELITKYYDAKLLLKAQEY